MPRGLPLPIYLAMAGDGSRVPFPLEQDSLGLLTRHLGKLVPAYPNPLQPILAWLWEFSCHLHHSPVRMLLSFLTGEGTEAWSSQETQPGVI